MADMTGEKKYTNEWEDFEPEFVTVIRCPACGEIILPDYATCVNENCSVEIKHRMAGLGTIFYYARDSEFIPEEPEDTE